MSWKSLIAKFSRIAKFSWIAAILSLASSPHSIHAQVVAAARGGSSLQAGGSFSIFNPDYGSNWLYGFGAYVDLNVGSHWGAEGEVRYLRFNQTYNVYEDNYLLGLRYRWHFNRMQPYVKFLAGNGQFNFPFSLAHGGFFMLAPGGGLDFHLNHRFTLRALDYEYQHWGNFSGSSLSPNGFSSGISYRFF